MKISKLVHWQPFALAAIGVFLGRGAHADTTVDFDTNPPGLGNNAAVIQSFGDYATASSDGVTVVGFGTPNIGLTWQGTGAQWQYYIDSVWAAGQLDSSLVGNSHSVVFSPNSASARVIVKSFNFHPYYDDATESYVYTWQVRSGSTVLTNNSISFTADAIKHPVSINYTGSLGQTLTLKLTRTGGTDGTGHPSLSSQNIAVDDISFAQLPEAVQPVGPQVVSVTPADDETSAPGIYSYRASITNGATALVAASIQLKLDGSPVSPPPTISSAGGLTNVSFQATGNLAAGSAHAYTLTYNDDVGSNYVNEVQFTVANYLTLPAAYAMPPGAGITRGFTYRTVSANTEATTLASTVARAKAQLSGTLINTNTSQPYTNSATLGTNADGSFNIDTVLNFDDDSIDSGNFTNDVAFPGLETGFNNWFSTEATLYLDLPAGYYRLGVNSDDGFEVSTAPPQGVSGSPIVLGIFDNGRGAFDTLFDFLVPTSGIYCFRTIYFESTGSASCELFSVNLATEGKILVNDSADANAIKSYRVLSPRITGVAQSGSNVVINWAYGTPPFQVQFKNDVSNPLWGDSGSTTMNRTATVPIQPGSGFIRVVGQ